MKKVPWWGWVIIAIVGMWILSGVVTLGLAAFYAPKMIKELEQ